MASLGKNSGNHVGSSAALAESNVPATLFVELWRVMMSVFVSHTFLISNILFISTFVIYPNVIRFALGLFV